MMMAFLLCMAIMWGWLYLSGQLTPKEQQPQETTAPQQPSETPGTEKQQISPPAEFSSTEVKTVEQIKEPALIWHVDKLGPPPVKTTIIGERIKKKNGYKSEITIDNSAAAIRKVPKPVRVTVSSLSIRPRGSTTLHSSSSPGLDT